MSAGPSARAVAAAKAHDPRVAARIQGLAGQQLKLSESLKDFEAYVGDLTKWSRQAQRGPVTTSLEEVTGSLRQEGVAQKMVDAGVDLSQENVAAARTAQADIEAALEKMTGRLREAGDILAGSKTGIVSRAARQAKEVAGGVRRLAGLPARGAGRRGDHPAGATTPGGPRAGSAGEPSARPGEGSPRPGGSRPDAAQRPRGDSLARRLAADQRRPSGASPGGGRPGPGANTPGGRRDEIDALWFKARDLARTLRDEELAEPAALDYVHRRVKDPQTFRRMFEKVRKAEAGQFADVVTGIGKSLDEVLEETLSAKKLHSERQEQCPPAFRPFVNAYFESLSKAATAKARPRKDEGRH